MMHADEIALNDEFGKEGSTMGLDAYKARLAEIRAKEREAARAATPAPDVVTQLRSEINSRASKKYVNELVRLLVDGISKNLKEPLLKKIAALEHRVAVAETVLRVGPGASGEAVDAMLRVEALLYSPTEIIHDEKNKILGSRRVPVEYKKDAGDASVDVATACARVEAALLAPVLPVYDKTGKMIGFQRERPPPSKVAAVDGEQTLIKALEKQISDLSMRNFAQYHGVWKANTVYAAGSIVTHAGSPWHAWANTPDKPGASENWQLMSKSERRPRP